jgi:hypothetical protein
VDLFIGTDDGLFALSGGSARRLRDGKVAHLASGSSGAWAIVDERIERVAGDQGQAPSLPAHLHPRCLLPAGEGLLIGTSEAHLYRVTDGQVSIVAGFDRAPDRETWHTPWGGPPDTRSLARDTDGTLYANVHVGGVLRSTDGEDWRPTMDIGADVHQVSAHPVQAGCVLAASARGLGLSFDGAASWQFTRDGLHSSYCRAVVATGEMVLISASAGPSGGRATLYRRSLRDDAPLERCTAGLPEWIAGNIDTGCLVASGSEVAFGTADGTVFVSSDTGQSWSTAAEGLPVVRALAIG